MDIKTPKNCNDYNIYEKRHENGCAVLINRRDFSGNPLLLTRRAEKGEKSFLISFFWHQ